MRADLLAGHRNAKYLYDRLSPEKKARVDATVRDAEKQMLLSELRKLFNLTQTDLAKALGVNQPEISRLESEDDMQISTLQRLLKALGGELEVSVTLPEIGRVKLTQFSKET